LLDVVKMRLAQIADLAKASGWASVVKELVFLHRTAIVVEKNLSEIADRPDQLTNSRLRVIELHKDAICSGTYQFALRSRKLKALHNLDLGYGGLALVRDNVIIGDTWYWAAESTNNARALHVDLRRFGFTSWLKNYAYTFDIFVAPAERKGGISAAFQNQAMLVLRSKGFTKAFGFYWADNIPAHWCTRVTNKWQKLQAVDVSRFLVFTKSNALATEQALPHAAPVWPRA
jgi:hypothetical protein